MKRNNILIFKAINLCQLCLFGGAVWGLTLCSSGAGAFVCVDQINAGASILTGLGLTLIDLFGAVYTMVPRHTLAGEKKMHHYIWSVT